MEKRGVNVFVVSTPYHLLTSSLICTPGDLIVFTGESHSTECMNKLINISFEGKSFVVPSFYSYKRNKLSLISFKKNMGKLKKQLKGYVIDSIYSFNDVNPVDQWIIKNIRHRRKVVIVEEGIGLYRDTKKRHKRFFLIFGKVFLGRRYEEINRIGESSSVTDIFCTDASKLSEIQKTRNITIIEPVDYTRISENLNISRIDGRIWFVGQPLVEDGIMNECDYIGGIKKICDKAKEKGTKLIIKPHPRENLEKYDALSDDQAIVIKESDVPIELLIDNSDEVQAYTYYSSAILAIAKINNCKTICLYKMYKNIDLPESIEALMIEAKVQIMEDWDW